MKNELSVDTAPRGTVPAAFYDKRLTAQYDGARESERRIQEGKHHPHFNLCPAWFPLLKKIRGGYPGGGDHSGAPKTC